MSGAAQIAHKQSNKYYSLAVLTAITVVSLLLWDVSWAKWLLSPVFTFVTAVHELGHATACLLTGGTVTGLTIVSDNSGHGGLTFCRGGIPFVYTQAGYLGTAFFGCLLIYLGRFPQASRTILVFAGLCMGTATLVLMTGTIFNQGRILEGLGSIIWGAALAGGLIWGGLKLNPAAAHLLLLFLAVQTALNSLTDVILLVKISAGLDPAANFSDATNMASLTGIPAFAWSIFWALASLCMLAGTLWYCYAPAKR